MVLVCLRPVRGILRQTFRMGVLDMSPTERPPRGAAGTSLLAMAGLCAVTVAAVFTGGCSPHEASSPTVARQPPAAPVLPPETATVLHWGSVFGGGPKAYSDKQTSPAAVTLPGTVAEVGTSNSTEYALLTNGSLYAWGLGTKGQLGDGSRESSFAVPVLVRFPSGVRIASIPTDAMPYDTALAVDTHGNVWGWGKNGGGELCLGGHKSYSTPVKLPFSHVTALAGASNHAQYDADGTVYACGQNITGDLGDGSGHSSTMPVRVAGLNGSLVTKLVASFADSGALLSNGDYFDWGYNGQGQLGDGHFHRSSRVPVRVKLPGPVTQVAQGGSYWGNGQTLVLLSDGSLLGWGDDESYQLGNRTRGVEAVPVPFRAPAGVIYKDLANGGATSYAVSKAGQVYAWGASHLGQLGDGHKRAAKKPKLVATGATSISSTATDVVIAVPDGA
jgi:alpha-tubulin suppressor-like RCC1 family protein